jgi:uncharacterized phage protein gp47/JayE
MPLPIPTTKTIVATILSFIESRLNQDSPLADKAYNRVISVALGSVFTTLYKFAAQETKENLAISASRAGLIKLGEEYDTPLKAAEAAVLTITLPAVDTTVIPQTVDFVGDPNGIRYGLAANSDPATGGLVTMSVTAKVTGATGNLLVSDTLTIGTQVPGAETTATVTVIENTGADAEETETYRARLLAIIRSPGGGGNAADYRNWSNEVAGVENSYPYAGQPGGGSPPDRTVYVEATSDIDPDGIAPGSLLTEVRTSITTDPVTGLSRQPLGLTDDTLYILSITRTSFYVQISGLSVDASKEAQVKADIETAVTAYFVGLAPFIDGLDPDFEKNDTVTDASVTDIVQDVVSAAGGFFTALGFGLSVGSFLPSYVLGQGEHAKLSPASGITYV